MRRGEHGLTLVEVLVTITIMAIITAATLPLLSTCLQAHAQGMARARLYHEGLMAMERLTGGARRCTYLLIPNSHTPVRDTLSVSGFIDEDNDYYFDDPLFPRVDEEMSDDMNQDGAPGLSGVDDDGDGSSDEGLPGDDDESGSADEEILDGIDNDADGNVDEDLQKDANGDGAPGIKGMDDDGDGQVDEGNVFDDDEDGKLDDSGLIPVVYTFDGTSNTLRETIPRLGLSNVLSTHVTAFQVTYAAPERIQIALTLTADDGETIGFVEYVYPRNTLQRTGKRVR